MALLVETVNSNAQAWIFYSGSIGIILGIFITSLFLFHLITVYYDLFCKNEINQGQQDKRVYIMVILFLSISLFQCISFVFLRTDLITNKSFTPTQCAIGYFIFWFLCFLGYFVLLLIFINRVEVVFEETVYECNKLLIKCCYFILFFNIIVIICHLTLIISTRDNWRLITDEQSNVTFCESSPNESKGWETKIVPITTWYMAIGYMATNAAFLFAFVQRLWKLKHEFMTEFVKRKPIRESSIDTESDRKNKATIDAVVDVSSRMSKVTAEVGTIVRLHDLIKKQTILLSIAVITTMIYMSLENRPSGLFEEDVSFLFAFDIIVNAICVWLTLSCSQRYWSCCVHFGVCRCCYGSKTKMTLQKMENM